MDCQTARLLLLFYRPGRTSDLAQDDLSSLESHLQTCPACSASLAKQASAQSAIAKMIVDVPIPSQLKTQLHAQVTAKLSALWRAKWLARATATAAMATFGVLSWSAYLAANRPTLDTESVTYQTESALESPERNALDWLNAERLMDKLPEDFDLRFVRFAGKRDLQGVSVHALQLDSPNSRQIAWVYFLAPGQFRTASAPDSVSASNATTRIYRELRGGWTVVVAFTGNDLRPFLKSAGITT